MMQDEPWYVQRLRELEAAAPVKHKGTTEPFVKLPLWWVEAVARATNSAAALVWVELLRLRWKTQRTTFPLPSNRLKKLGVSRDVKRRVLYDLERAGLISIERRSRKTPIVTLNLL
ncbi:MAG: hypothetical protein AUI16_21215 [Alphaproteobacteria bacterium 13_2_20CM_2_64_7]|jgi:hypothetical protein|nr:MAG: hypothetical protein AUI16_21215 [Alphaproteobacteria bacterium 13_2_20CM_2_64_7]